MKYELTNTDIDIISFALKNHINYLEGLLMLNEQYYSENEKKLAVVKTMLRETKRVQKITTYDGQPISLREA